MAAITIVRDDERNATRLGGTGAFRHTMAAALWRSRGGKAAQAGDAHRSFVVLVGATTNFGAVYDCIKTPLTAFAVFTLAGATSPHSTATTRAGVHLLRAGTGHIHMTAYRITERDHRFIVGTELEAVLICRSLEVAHQAVADAKLLETQPAKLIFARRVAREGEEGS
jgi:hypothetical protein